MDFADVSMTLVLLVLLALAFDFMNGFHDAANSIATVVSTGVLKPWQAVLWAAFFKCWHGRSSSVRRRNGGQGNHRSCFVDSRVIFGA
jgi:PiT family inorganic phosphate transporter